MTLAELYSKVTGRKVNRQIGRRQLLERKEPVIASMITTLGSDSIIVRLRVFRSGYVLYEEDNLFTVFHLNDVYGRGTEYHSLFDELIPLPESKIPGEVFMDTEWYIRLLIEGSDRIIRNREKIRNDHIQFSYSDIAEAIPPLAYTPDFFADITDEINQRRRQAVFDYISSNMNPTLWRVYVLIESEGKKQKEVAKELGITPQAVSKDYKKARKKIIELRDYLNEAFPEDDD